MRWSGLFFTTERAVITVGLLIGVVFGLVGGALGNGSAQALSYAISSFGLVAGSMVLAARNARRRQTVVAAGYALLAVAEVVTWAGGTSEAAGGSASFAGGTMFYVPALALISLPRVLPSLVRALGAIAAVPWAAHGFRHLTGDTPPPDSLLAIAGYLLLSLAILGWIAALARIPVGEERSQGRRG